jgi:hypothetical protein
MKANVFPLRTHTKRRFDPEALTQAELDIMKEKAEALGRVGGRLDESLRRIRILEQRITMLEREGVAGSELPHERV